MIGVLPILTDRSFSEIRIEKASSCQMGRESMPASLMTNSSMSIRTIFVLGLFKYHALQNFTPSLILNLNQKSATSLWRFFDDIYSPK